MTPESQIVISDHLSEMFLKVAKAHKLRASIAYSLAGGFLVYGITQTALSVASRIESTKLDMDCP